MRVILGCLTGLLLLIALVGIVAGTFLLVTASRGSGSGADLYYAMLIGAVPFVIGTVALGSGVIALSIAGAADMAHADALAAKRKE